jgi:sortase A
LSTAKFNDVRSGTSSNPLVAPTEVDFGLWSPKRIAAYRETLLAQIDTPMAILRVPRLKIEVAVLEGTDEFALNRGAGWIQGTSRPGAAGNVGIAAHRDGFFRALKDVQIGDTIELTTLTTNERYMVDEIVIVTPDDTGVLGARPRSSVTLVTCFPFYFVGDAPRRFIVHASVVDSSPSASQTRPELAR